MSGLYPGASWRPISGNHSGGSAEPNKLLVVHVMQGSLAGTDSWFHNPAASASAHFGVGNAGTVIQWVSCNDMAWHACAANGKSIGVETEGFTGTPFTDRQIVAIAKILKWAHQQYPDIKLWLNTNAARGSGLSYHGLGGAAWCNHPACPGSPRIKQLPQIVRLARR